MEGKGIKNNGDKKKSESKIFLTEFVLDWIFYYDFDLQNFEQISFSIRFTFFDFHILNPLSTLIVSNSNSDISIVDLSDIYSLQTVTRVLFSPYKIEINNKV